MTFPPCRNVYANSRPALSVNRTAVCGALARRHIPPYGSGGFTRDCNRRTEPLPVAFMAGLGIVALLIAAAILVNHFSTPAGPQVDKPLPMGTTEQAYAPQIHFLGS